jgi:hypothetical protein
MKRIMAHAMTEQTTRWRLSEDFLIEEASDGIRLWGRWDRQFGCWNQDGLTVLPQHNVLGHLGRWADPCGPRDDEWYESRAGLTAYWTLVPTSVRLGISRLSDGQWQALMGSWQATISATRGANASHGEICLGGSTVQGPTIPKSIVTRISA